MRRSSFSAKDLPLKYAGISPCFRREAGAHGKDQKGIFRVHQFDKVEQFIFCRQEDEDKYFDELLKNSEDIWQTLDIPYQLRTALQRRHGPPDVQDRRRRGLVPGPEGLQGAGLLLQRKGLAEREARHKVRGGREERKYVYTLNNTAISMQRTLACLVENYANADGSIYVPDVLVPYMGKSRIAKQ